MKRWLFALVMLTFIPACEEKPKNSLAEYGDSMINAYQKGKQAGEDGNLDAVRKAIQTYHAAHDTYPLSMEEVKPLINSELDFSKYDYHPQSGTVSPKVN